MFQSQPITIRLDPIRHVRTPLNKRHTRATAVKTGPTAVESAAKEDTSCPRPQIYRFHLGVR